MRLPRRRSLTQVLAGAMLLGGCQAEEGAARPQWLVTLSTDAPVPQFGDRVLIEIVDEAGEVCTACRRLVDASEPSAWPMSFGVVPTGGALRVRARLLRAATLLTGAEPPPGSTIDLIVPLSDDVRDVGARLSMDCFGIDADVAGSTTCDPDTGSLASAAEVEVGAPPWVVGSWGPGQPDPCEGPSPPGMICVEGGAFLLGDASAAPFGPIEEQTTVERLVRVSAFHLDEYELTVGDYLALREQDPLLPEPFQTGPAGTNAQFCQYRGPSDTSTAAFPLNCLDKTAARSLCKARGMRLPTEAEWELAAGNGPLETRYPWGDDPDICAHAIVARADPIPGECRETPAGILPPGPQPSDGRDRTLSGIADLGGNLEEWVADDFSPYGSGCWSALRHEDPVCEGDLGLGSVRGGHWTDAPLGAEVVRRAAVSALEATQWRGLRCAKSDP